MAARSAVWVTSVASLGITSEAASSSTSLSWAFARHTILWKNRTRIPTLAPCVETRLRAADSDSFPLVTEPSSESAGPSSNGIGEMSVEERDAIMAFEGLTGQEQVDSGENPSGTSSDGEMIAQERNEFLTFETGKDTDMAVQLDEEVSGSRTKPRNIPRAIRGHTGAISNVMAMFLILLDRPIAVSSATMMGSTGSAVVERIEDEVKKMRGLVQDAEFEQYLFEVLRVVKLLQMDLQSISAARKDITLFERITLTKSHCQQLLNVVDFISRSYAS